MNEYVNRKDLRDELYDANAITMEGVKIVNQFPSADVAPVRHGRWEPYFEDIEIYNTGGFTERKQTGWICGRCKSEESITPYYKTNYCPNCGAKMDGVSE